MNKKQTLSIIIPVFNEERTITSVIKSVSILDLPNWQKEIIIIDDGSTDTTVQKIKRAISSQKNVRLLLQVNNQGKGAAVIRGMKEAKGDYIIIQDADLEYQPEQIPLLLLPVEQQKAEVVYGTRLKRFPNLHRDERTPLFLLHYLGNRALSLLLSLLYGQWLTDIETGYKLIPARAIRDLSLTARGFEFEPEITVQLIKRGYIIYEVPIQTNPRGYDKGKKLQTIPDGIKAFKTILKYR